MNAPSSLCTPLDLSLPLLGCYSCVWLGLEAFLQRQDIGPANLKSEGEQEVKLWRMNEVT